MEELEIAVADLVGGGATGALCTVRQSRPDETSGAALGATLVALESLFGAVPQGAQMLLSAAESGSGLTVAFRPEILRGLSDGSLKLMESASGTLPIAVDSTSGSIVAQSRVVRAGIGQAGGGAALAPAAIALLPGLVAGAAAYAQQARMEKMLRSIETAVKRIEVRMEDSDHGRCDAAEGFISTALDALRSGPLPPYLRSELAVHRAGTEALFAARLRFVRRLKEAMEKEQIAYESKRGERQPWVDSVDDMARSGQLEQEVVLFVRALMCQSRLDALAAGCIAEDGAADVALRLLDRSTLDLRFEFFDLHNRLRPLAAIAPPASLRAKVPLMNDPSARAHETAKVLVDQLNRHVLPSIPDPHSPQPTVIRLAPAEVLALAA